jgi:hypothetical protein
MRGSLALVALLCACADNPVPGHRIPAPADLGRQPTGSWIAVTGTDGVLVVGELIAIDRGQMFVLPEDRRLWVRATDQIARARLVAYAPDRRGIWTWGGLGTLSTITHGGFLFISAPVWIATTVGALVWDTQGAFTDTPDRGLEEIRAYARFPQGLPEGVNANSLVGASP